ncbi:MAG: LysM peptidoglycan-binding domain-containing protein [Chloroflexota bacterium]|nr:MAG: LysM peptidoglycan-binding domain-containing protein [Chloroflexota bacterium]
MRAQWQSHRAHILAVIDLLTSAERDALQRAASLSALTRSQTTTSLRMRALPQTGETPVTAERGDGLTWRFAYSRSAESVTGNRLGEDFLITAQRDGTLCFALCDGVSGSFYGDIAARFLGRALVEWLAEIELDADLGHLQVALAEKLASWTGAASQQVNDHAIPTHVTGMLRSVLESVRIEGSQTVFAAGRIDAPHPGANGKVLLAWMGNVRIRIWSSHGERSADLGGVFHDSQRWSSRSGASIPTAHMFQEALKPGDPASINRILLFSDGLSSLGETSTTISDAAVRALLADALESPSSDDATFLEAWVGPTPATLDAKSPPPPTQLSVKGDVRRAFVSWASIDSATAYDVELCKEVPILQRTDATSKVFEQLAPGRYTVRIRSRIADEVGIWSTATVVEVVPGATEEAGGPCPTPGARGSDPSEEPEERAAAQEEPAVQDPDEVGAKRRLTIRDRLAASRRLVAVLLAACVVAPIAGLIYWLVPPEGLTAPSAVQPPTAQIVAQAAKPSGPTLASAPPTSTLRPTPRPTVETSVPGALAQPTATGTPSPTARSVPIPLPTQSQELTPTVVTPPSPAPSPTEAAQPSPNLAPTQAARPSPTLIPGQGTPPSAVATPTGPPALDGTYRVLPGDTLTSIAQSVFGDATRWRLLYDANRDVIGPDSSHLLVGAHLRIPTAATGGR